MIPDVDIVFCHGLESAPHGAKYHALVAAGLAVVAPDCQKLDLAQRVTRLTQSIVEHKPAVVVGSSFGGIAGLLAAIRARELGVRLQGLLLCAPALALPDPGNLQGTRCAPAPTTIIHGAHDDICPIGHSQAFAQQHGARIVEVDDGHTLRESLELIVSHAQTMVHGPPAAGR